MMKPDSVHVIAGAHVRIDHRSTLALGKGFIPLPKRRPHEEIHRDMELFTRRLRLHAMFGGGPATTKRGGLYWPNRAFQPDPAGERLEAYIASLSTALKRNLRAYSNRPFAPLKVLRVKQISQCLRYLRENELVCTLADKNLGLTITPSAVYDREMLKSLADGFAEIGSGESARIIASCHDAIVMAATRLLGPESVYEDGNLLKCLTNMSTPLNSGPSKPYLLWKVHKMTSLRAGADLAPPSRLIVPAHGNILCTVSKHVDALVRPVFNRLVPQSLPDTNTLLRDIESTIFPQNCSIVTRDVVALYPSVDIDDGLVKFRNFLAESWLPDPVIRYCVRMTELVMRNNLLTYRDRQYVQRSGVAMGNPLAPLFANIWVHMLERDLIRRFQVEGRLLLYRRLIDDIFSVFDSAQSATEFWSAYSTLHPNLAVTGPSIPTHTHDYCDLVISKGSRFYREGRLDTKLHQKRYNTYGYLPYESYHPPATLTAWITAEAMRAIKACSNQEDFDLYLPIFVERLLARRYPPQVILAALKNVDYKERNRLIFGDPENARNERGPRNEKKYRTPFVTRYNPTVTSFNLRGLLSDGWDQVVTDSDEHPPPILSYRKERNLFSILRKTICL